MLTQGCVEPPMHAAPPLDGEGLVQERVCVPAPHVVEHVDQADHPPATGAVVNVVQVAPLQPALQLHVAVGSEDALPAVTVQAAVLAMGQLLHGL